MNQCLRRSWKNGSSLNQAALTDARSNVKSANGRRKKKDPTFSQGFNIQSQCLSEQYWASAGLLDRALAIFQIMIQTLVSVWKSPICLKARSRSRAEARWMVKSPAKTHLLKQGARKSTLKRAKKGLSYRP
jgi:hypothetical protein